MIDIDIMPQLTQIKASAGSGKTYGLTRRFLLRLTQCGNNSAKNAFAACAPIRDDRPLGLGDILAVTFTNAAAVEMRDRVIRHLKNAALGNPAGDFSLPADRARAWVDAIVRDLSALNIRTIDSLLLLIVRAAALELNLPPDFQPVFSTEEALTPYLDIFIEQASRGDDAMRELLRQACLALVNHDNTPGFLAGDKLRRKLREVLDDVLRGKYAGRTPRPELEAKLHDMKTTAVQAAKTLLATAMTHNLPWHKTALAAVAQLAEGRMKSCASVYAGKNNAGELFHKNTTVPDSVATAFKAYAAQARNWTRTGELIRQALGLEPFMQLAETLVEAFLQSLEQEGALPTLLTPRLAGAALNGDHGVPDMLCRLGTRLRHFLLDEFQDTSREQWLALHPLVLEALSRGGSLTCVGDVKQSIYSWRGGESELFDSVFEDVELTQISPRMEQHILPFNRRSRREVVEHNNRFFAPLADAATALQIMRSLMPQDTPEHILQTDAHKIHMAFAEVVQQCPPETQNGGFVRIEQIQAHDAAALSEAAPDCLCRLLREEIQPRRPLSDVLVLTRGNATARLAAERLVREGLPVITENSLLLAGHPLIVQTVAMLRFLDAPEDDIAFWTVLTGSVLRDHPEAAGLAWESLHDWRPANAQQPLYLNFRAHRPHVWERLLAPFYNQSGLMTPYDIVQEWFARLDVESRFTDARTFLRRFLEVLQHAEEKGLADLPSFLAHWQDKGGEEKVPMPENMNAVRIMTIHKSKGLEAPVVILPWTDFRSYAANNTIAVEKDGMLLAAPNRKSLGEPYYADMARQARETLHLLYVAFTRAKDELYAFRTVTPHTKKLCSLGAAMDILWRQAGFAPPYISGTPPPTPARDTKPAAPTPSAPSVSPQPVPTDWRPMLWLPRLKIFRNPLGRPAFTPEKYGELIHFCLKNLKITGKAGYDASMAVKFSLAHFPLPVPRNETLRKELTDMLEWYASCPEAARWMAHGMPEQSMTDKDGRTLRMDLLVREPEGLLIVEYKSGQPQPRHLDQIRRYLACLAESGEAGADAARAVLVYISLRRFQPVSPHSASPLCEAYE